MAAKTKKTEVRTVATPKPQWKKIFPLFLAGIIIGAGGMYAYSNYVPQADANFDQIQRYVGSMIELPNETPTLATVSDIAKLRDQSFFIKAQNGDKVLIYPNTKLAILYRPSIHKIINIGPITVRETQNSSTPTGSQSATISQPVQITVAIYNGNGKTGLAKTVESSLQNTFPSGSVVFKQNTKINYKKTIVVDVTGKKKTEAASLAKIVNGTVAPLPKGETTPNAELLIILGEDYK